MRLGTLTEAVLVAKNMPEDFIRRDIQGPNDWGNQDTRLASLKRRGKSFLELKFIGDFGYFFGEYEGRWYVAIKDMNCKIIYCEVYESLEELKNQWELD